MRRPWFKFWPADWRGDPRLRACSLAARGLWIELCAIMHEGQPYGHCALGDAALSLKELAALVGAPVSQVGVALAELDRRGVFSRTPEGVIYSRRMVRDEVQREEGKSAGKKGGNPALNPKRDWITGGDNPPPKGQALSPPPTPREPLASSGSSGSSLPEKSSSSLRSEEGAGAPETQTGSGGVLPGIELKPPKGKRDPTQDHVDLATVRPIWLEAWLARYGKAYLGLDGAGKLAKQRRSSLRTAFKRLDRDEAEFRRCAAGFIAAPPFRHQENPDPIAFLESLDSVRAGLTRTAANGNHNGSPRNGTPRHSRRPDGTRPGEYPEPLQFPRVFRGGDDGEAPAREASAPAGVGGSGVPAATP